MENASRALVMAGGVLIAIIILSLMVYVFQDFGAMSAEIHKETARQQIIQFNSKFTSYESYKDEDGSYKNLSTIHDIITVASLARENNNYYRESTGDDIQFENEYKIDIVLSRGGETNLSNVVDFEKVKKDLINEDTKKIEFSEDKNLPRYKCTITKYHENGRIAGLLFKNI